MYVSRLAGGLLAAGLAFWCGTGTAAAQLYEQPPSGPAQNYAYQSSTNPYGYRSVLADSFQVTQSTLLTRVMWWGVYDGEPPNELYNESFIIRIRADGSGQPGALLATFNTSALTTSRTATGRTLTFPWEWSDPVAEYSYKWTLTTPVPLQANTTYWLEIEQTVDYTPPVTWHWSHSAHPDNRGVQVGSGDPVYWYQEDRPWDPTMQSLANAAFRLDAFAVPPSYATYEQPRLNNVGGAPASTTEWADSFVFTEASTIKRVAWWGGYAQYAAYSEPDDFTLRIYADDAGQPGTVLATYEAGQVFRWDYEPGYLELPGPEDSAGGVWSHRFEYTLPTPFAVQANTRYWLSIVNARTDEKWLWQASDSTNELGAQFRAVTPAGEPWTPHSAAPVHDLAFRLETAPPPVFEQRPIHSNQMMPTAANSWTVADPFKLTETADITRISWWGGYFNSTYHPLPGSDNFTVHIFADNGGQPGAVIATYTPGDQVFRTLTGEKAEYEWPGFPAAVELFYSIVLPAPLTLQGNTRYWISINSAEYPNYVAFGWEYSEYNYNNGSGLFSSFADPVVGPWQHWGDLSPGMAFRLDR